LRHHLRATDLASDCALGDHGLDVDRVLTVEPLLPLDACLYPLPHHFVGAMSQLDWSVAR